jgi:tetratricopeptide (TPR) repeat protein
MDALISARAGLALIFDRKRNKIALFRGGNSAPASVVDASLLLDDVKKLEDASQDEIHRQFRKNVAQEEAIDLALLAIDPQLSQRTRAAAVRELETIIEQKGMLDGLKNVLYARPLPASSSISDAVSISKGNNCKAVSQFFKDLQLLQPSIRDIWLAWTAISEAEISSIESKEAFQSALLSSGLFAQFAEAVPVKKVNELLLRALSDPVLASMPGARDLFLKWAEPFRNLKDQSALYPTEEDWENPETEKRSRPTRSKVPHLREILSRVKAQKEAIKDALNRRDISLAHKFLADLKTDQLKHGGAKFLVKSLCDIAMEAKRIGFYEFQLKLLEDAAELERGDPRVWCQLGDSLLTRDRPLKALEAFKQAEALGDERGGMIGRAEVAKATNDLPQALQLYDKVIEVFPDDPVPQNARAEILKLLNSLDDALAE